jgi:hypothetical protein
VAQRTSSGRAAGGSESTQDAHTTTTEVSTTHQVLGGVDSSDATLECSQVQPWGVGGRPRVGQVDNLGQLMRALIAYVDCNAWKIMEMWLYLK